MCNVDLIWLVLKSHAAHGGKGAWINWVSLMSEEITLVTPVTEGKMKLKESRICG